MSAEQPAVPLRPLGAGEILDAAIKVVRRHFRTLAMCVLVVAVPLAILDTLIRASTMDHPFDFSLNATGRSTELDAAQIGGTLASAVINFLLAAVTGAACFRAVGAGYLGSGTTWQESLAFAGRRLPSVLLVLLLVALATIGGVIACILPGIWLWVSLYLAEPALLFEDCRGRAALRRSFGLVKGRWWPTFGVLVVGAILVSVVQSAFALLVGVGLAAGDPSEIVSAVLITLVSIVGYTLSSPIQAAIVALVYFDLRVRKEGFDLQLLAQRIGAGPAIAEPIAPIGYPVAPPPPQWPPPDPGAGSGFLPPQPPPDRT